MNVLFDPYVISRVSKQIHMDNLGTDDAKHFVRDIPEHGKTEKFRQERIFLFTEDTVEIVVANIVSITLRKVIDAMQQLLVVVE